MSVELSKRALSAGAAVGALALLTQGQRAAADTPFTSFPFAATGAPQPRTMPDRLKDLINVKDFGAKGDGATNDQPAIQAAVNWTSNSARGGIFFPPGIYVINAPIDLTWVNGTGGGQASFIISGCGDASKINSNLPGRYVFQRNNTTYTNNSSNGTIVIEKMTITNGSSALGSGAIIIASNVCVRISDLRVGAQNGIVLQNGNDTSSGVGLFVFTSTITNCSLVGFGKASNGGAANGDGIACSQGCVISGCDIVGFNVGIRCYATSNNILGGRLEVNTTGILTGIDQKGNRNAGNGNIAIIGPSFESNDTTIDMTSGAVCVTIQNVGIASIDGHGVDGIVLKADTGTRIGIFNCQVVGGWTGYGIRAPFTGAIRAYRTFIGVSVSNSSSESRNWEMPTKAYGGAFINCNNPDPLFTYANLPSGNDAITGLPVNRNGDEYIISDSPTAMSGNFGAIVTAGGGSNRVKVRWNGSNWVIC